MMDDEWVIAFGSKAGPPLKEIFESELGALPKPLVKLLQQLQEGEKVLLAAD